MQWTVLVLRQSYNSIILEQVGIYKSFDETNLVCKTIQRFSSVRIFIINAEEMKLTEYLGDSDGQT